MAKANKIYRALIYILPAVLYFSYYPIISLGSNGTMNFELSLPLIWLVIFDTVALFIMLRKRILFRKFGRKWVWLLFPIFVTLSVLWSMNFLRGVLTAGILWLIYFAEYAFWSLRSLFNEVGFKEKFWKVFFGSALFAGGWCFLQCVLDLAGVSREVSLMCAGCTYRMFGFPHPNGFAIEPQFMGNLLLAPALVSAWLFMEKHNSKIFERKPSRGVVLTTGQADSARYFSAGSSSVPVVETTTGSGFLCSKILLLCFFMISVMLFLTFSRGAIYAFVVAMIFMVVMEGVRQKSWRVGKIFIIIALAFVFTLNLQGIMAQVSPTNDTYATGVAKVLNHLSLGVIDVRGNSSEEGASREKIEASESEETEALESVKTEGKSGKKENDDKEKGPEEAIFDGYVAESTDTRLKLTGAAVEVWKKDSATVLFGVGLGGAGQALYVNGLSPAPKEIVQNEYASLLLETGIVGIVLLILTMVLIIRVVIKSQLAPMMLALIVAYAITLLFFSGLPNALQIYLLPALLWAFLWKEKSNKRNQ